MVETISQRVNALFAQYVAIECAQYECNDSEADALGEQAFEVSAQIHAISDRSGNADFIASRILLDLMLNNCWPELDRIEWDLDGKWHIALLESIAARTTGAVRKECTKALATIGVTVPPEHEDPLASLIADYRRLLDQHNARSPADLPTDTEEEAHAAATWRPLYERLEGDCPAPTSLAGVREALRLALNREMGDHMPAFAESLLRASLVYLEGVR